MVAGRSPDRPQRLSFDVPDDAPVYDLVVSVASGETGCDELVLCFKERLVRA